MSDYTRPGLPKSDPSLLRLQLVGPMQALTLDNENVLPPGRKTRGLLAILAMSGRRPVLRSKLAEMLWSRRSEEQARASLRQEIHRLLDALAPVGATVVSVERHSLALRPGLTSVDAERLLNANVNHVIAQANANAGAQLGGGASNYALPPLDGVLLEELNGTDPALDAWLASERRRLHEHALALYEAALQRRPDPGAAIAICRQLLLLDPLHEAAWRGLIRAQLLQGERGAALQSADRCAELFSTRVSGPPSVETSRLLSELRNSVASVSPEGAKADREPGAAAPGAAAPGPSSDPEQDPVPAPAPAAVSATTAEENAVVSITGHRLHGRSIVTLAVLPPLDLDAGANDKLVPALTEELVAGLATRPILGVISGSALAQALALGRDDSLLRRNFGLDYVLDGTILRGPGKIRIILRLLDLRLQGHVVWAKRFDCDPADAMVKLDEVASVVSAQLPWELLVIESRRVGSRPASELSAVQLTLRAFSLVMRPERQQNDKAGDLLARAEALDPDHVLTAMIDAVRHFIRAMQGWGSYESEGSLAEAAMHKAFNAGQVLPPGIALAGLIRGQLLDDARCGMALIDRALAINPTMSIAHVFAAFLLARTGELDEAERRFGIYKRLCPLHPLYYMLDGIAVTIALLQGRMETAANLGRELTELTPSLLYPAIPCLAAFGHLGLHAEAERLLARIHGLMPELSVERVLEQMRLQREVDRACVADGLRAAGMAQAASDGDNGKPHGGGATKAGGAAVSVRLAT
jgi:DNA-binding SARP family transcriptional activator/TolB-like protein